MFYPNKMEYHFGTVIMICLLFIMATIGYAVGHGTMLHDCQDIMSSKLPVPSPIYAFKG